MVDEGQFFWGRFVGGLFHMGGLMIRSWQGQGSFTNAFFSNLKTANLKIFAILEGIYT